MFKLEPFCPGIHTKKREKNGHRRIGTNDRCNSEMLGNSFTCQNEEPAG